MTLSQFNSWLLSGLLVSLIVALCTFYVLFIYQIVQESNIQNSQGEQTEEPVDYRALV